VSVTVSNRECRKWQVMDMGISLSSINNVGLEQFITTNSKSIVDVKA
jgi:hypothetical protein